MTYLVILYNLFKSKVIFQGTVNGTRRRERPRMKWSDNIKTGRAESL